MKSYEFNGKRILDFNGDLFIQLDPVDVAVATTSLYSSVGDKPQPLTTERRRRRPNLAGRTSSKSHRLEPDDMRHIKEMINAGYKPAEIAPKYGISVQYIYMLKMQMKKKGELTLTEQP